MKNTKIPPPKLNLKGIPPEINTTKNNIEKPLNEELVAFNFRVTAEFRKRVRQYAIDNDTTAVKVMINAIEEYINK